MRRKTITALSLATLGWHAASCVSSHVNTTSRRHATRRVAHAPESSERALMLQAEARASAAGRHVLETGREMTLARREIIPGGCWDYADAVYSRAGFKEAQRRSMYKTAKRGPYADPALLQPGDLLSYVNHSYGEIEHSAIFVEWIDASAKKALMLSYGGEQRREPARYLPYDLSSVYEVVRPANRR